MIGVIARKLFGSSNERRIKGYMPRVHQINALEKELEGLSDEALRARTEIFRKQITEGASLDDILVPAFATCREASKRTLGQRHFDGQLIGGEFVAQQIAGVLARPVEQFGLRLLLELRGIGQRLGRQHGLSVRRGCRGGFLLLRPGAGRKRHRQSEKRDYQTHAHWMSITRRRVSRE